MNKKGRWLLSVLYVAVYLVVYFYLKRSGLWAHYRWTGLAFVLLGLSYIFSFRKTSALILGCALPFSFAWVESLFS